MFLSPGIKYRLRMINIAPNLIANVELKTAGNTVTWSQIAKDGAKVPARLSKPCTAALHIASGETYDYELKPESPGEITLQIVNPLNQAMLVNKIIVAAGFESSSGGRRSSRP